MSTSNPVQPPVLDSGATTAPGRHGARSISDTTSVSFSVAKVVAIFTVLLGHWFVGTILWVPVTFGLFVFAFSSAYFTGKIYGVEIDKPRFWKRKLERLGVRYWLILGFLCIVLAFTDRTVLHWHSVLHFLGLSGALNWFGVANQSGLGAGLWFFTLLLLFYLAYPYIARLTQSSKGGMVVTIGATAAAMLAHEHIKVGHELWLTSLGFVLGVVYALHEVKLNSLRLGYGTIAGCVLLVVLNAPQVNLKQFNALLIMLISIAICIWLASRTAPVNGAMRQVAKLDKYLLEIFLIHGYLFVRPTGNTWADLALSIALIMAAAVTLQWIERHVSSWLFDSIKHKQLAA